MKIIECVPNISEGRNRSIIEQVTAAVRQVEGVALLDVDPGAETNRTVYTFVGPPEPLLEAAFVFTRTATGLIDMSRHHGAHARMGAVDVVPFVPVGGGASMEDCIELAKRLGARIGSELEIPVFLYENAATREERRSLADVRRGEYEGLAARLEQPEWKPDFGPARFVPRSGATAVGARPFLIAYNVDLNTSERKLAHDIALEIREQGRFARDESGRVLRDEQGNKLRRPGRHRAVRAVGWYIPEFGRAQVSINLTDFSVTPPHVVFDTIREEARRRGLRVTGSEVVGLIPLSAVRQAGEHYLRSQGRTPAVPEPDLVACAVASLGLDDVKPFEAEQAVIDYRLTPRETGLRALSVTGFADELSRSTPAPGGGSVAALLGSLGAALTSMVAALTHSPGLEEDQRGELERIGLRAQELKDRLLRAIDEDTEAFEAIGAARRMPRKTDRQREARQAAIVEANRRAIAVPRAVVAAAGEVAGIAAEIAERGLEAAASDAGVAAWCARAAAEAAGLNVRINLSGIEDRTEAEEIAADLDSALAGVRAHVERALKTVEGRL